MANKYTPGPWKAETDHVGRLVIYCSGCDHRTYRAPIALVYQSGDHGKEAKGNARLIEAATQLLKTTKALLNIITGASNSTPERIDAARTLIDWIEGGTKE